MSFSPLGHVPFAGAGMRRFDELRDSKEFLPHLVAVLGGQTPDPELYPWQAPPYLILLRNDTVLVDPANQSVMPVDWAQKVDAEALPL